MSRRLVPLAALLFLIPTSSLQAQLNLEEYKQFNRLLGEPDGPPAFGKRLSLIGAALEREATAKTPVFNTISIDLKGARIPAADGVPFLVKWLDRPSETVQRSALRMLAVYGIEAKSAGPAVLGLVKQAPSRVVRAEAMLTLARIEPGNAANAAAIFDQLGADDADDASKRAALKALIGMAPVVPKSAPTLLATFYDHRLTDIGMLAHELIGKVLALDRPSLEQLNTLTTLEWKKSPDQGYAVFATISDAANRAEFAVPLLLKVLEEAPPAYLECVTLDALAKVRSGKPEAISAFLDRLKAKDPQVRMKARTALPLIDLKQPEAVRTLAAGLRHADPLVRLDIAVALRSWDEQGRMPPPAHAEMLKPLLEVFAELDEKTVTSSHLEAYLALLRRFGTRAAPAGDGLLKFYQAEAYFKRMGTFGAELRGKILAALANVGVPEAGRALVLDVLKKGPVNQADGGYAFAAAARAGATFASAEEVMPLLLPGLNVKGTERALYFIDWSGDGLSKPTTVKLETLRALAKLKAAEAVPAIQEIADRKDLPAAMLESLVYQEARRAYQTITGKALPLPKGLFADGSKKDMLHLDERLQVKMTLKLRNPRPGDVLKRLQQATNLKFMLDENADPDILVWASTHTVNMPAWSCMRQLASSPNVQGVWEDVGDGYRLVAKKKTADLNAPKVAKAFPPFRDDSFDPMPDDPRLQKSLSIQVTRPKVSEVLKRVSDATGVTLTTEKVDPDPLNVGVSWGNSSAWLVLRNLAELPGVQGTWEKVGDGYQLRGTYVAPLVAAQPVANRDAPVQTPNADRPSLRLALLLGGGFLVTILVAAGSGLLLYLRQRAS